ncbi:MAG: 3-methyladenine DNA glycosylase AlkD [Crocinitomicaceae bacterium]|jgi:3-methyladenine DNA glycosylase AlkD
MSINTHLKHLTDCFELFQDEAQAKKMSAYMKGLFPYYGVSAPQREQIQKEWFASIKGTQYDFWELIIALYDREEREFQMVAIDLLKKRPVKQYELDDWKQLERVLVSKSWWDTVDLIASNYVGNYFKRFPEQLEMVIDRWRESDNMWLNRTCLIFQLKYKEKLDFELLVGLIDQFKGNKEFFIQKAIGWSLRQHSKFDPESVRDYLDQSGLVGLAKREASKYL